ncbi:MAG: hypothetical protein CL512_04970 [Actinobacteria bacterium]|nr:hypothetical protein [Actinomycetota bacterium]|tara:strand:+ start:243 stop:638 length:396 start_codon:yes stop_codon:yes gene_type:complete
MVFIKNSFTGQTTTDVVGSKDELKYYRVLDAINREENPQKKFYDSRTEYVLDSLFKLHPGKIESYESSIRMNINAFDNAAMDNIHKNYKKNDISPVLDCISSTPVVSFTEIIDTPTINDGFTKVTRTSRIS